jgi:hypothetical protein
MTKEQIDLLIEDLRLASRQVKGRQQQREYLADLEKYYRALKEKYGIADRVPS